MWDLFFCFSSSIYFALVALPAAAAVNPAATSASGGATTDGGGDEHVEVSDEGGR